MPASAAKRHLCGIGITPNAHTGPCDQFGAEVRRRGVRPGSGVTVSHGTHRNQEVAILTLLTPCFGA
jgi:hypothetical protein